MIAILTILVSIVVWLLYKRYVPVRGVPCIQSFNHDIITIVDVRDYNESSNSNIPGAINIPVAYLDRYYNEINNKKIYIVAADHLEKNVSIRSLRKRGFSVMGYTLTECTCSDKKYYGGEDYYGVQ
ncbi:hypothetical protein SM124_05850 [Bacillus sp. 31A1R]|uniref:Rhodanese domain-containing protein n=1 Tax=Robertmurraya mangrovi TaxID=3098077 RepID=A0ABU5IVV7_9BACI|nr:rhodanese-like domain-containing protein [Bacillus sp. 31A1R]MDZ5471265.1 hypothetical protein [Bacillus sp. 31A1R]